MYFVVMPRSFWLPGTVPRYSTSRWSSSGTRISSAEAMLILSAFISTLSLIMNRVSR